MMKDIGSASEISTSTSNNSQATTRLEILLRNGLWINNHFPITPGCLDACILRGAQEQSPVEVTHKCRPRQLLYEELRNIIPSYFQGENVCWFRTLNREASNAATCLFEGAKLEMNLYSSHVPEFGFCFPRSAFILERDEFNLDLIHSVVDSDWAGWKRRPPSDSDRLRVNRKGWEVLYFVQLPPSEMDITISDLKAELCYSLRIQDPARIAFAAGPFYWGKDYREDGKGIYSNYFGVDLLTEGRHMKTSKGSALLGVFENRDDSQVS